MHRATNGLWKWSFDLRDNLRFKRRGTAKGSTFRVKPPTFHVILGSLQRRLVLCHKALCSRNFQNVKLRLDFVEIWSFYCHFNFMWNQILVNSKSLKMLFLAIWEILGNLELLKSKFRTSKIVKNDIFGPFEFAKMWFHVKSEWR